MTTATTKEIVLSSLAASLTAGFMFLVATQPSSAEPIPPQQDNPIIQHTMDQPTPLETLINDVLVDCGSTYYHLDGCSLGYRGVTW